MVKKYFNNLSIIHKLVWAFLLVVILPIAGLSVMYYRFESRTAIEREMESLRSSSNQMANDIDKYLVTNKNLVGFFSINREIGEFLQLPSPTNADVEKFNEWLISQIVISPEINVLYVLDRNGICLASTDPSFIGENYGFRFYFKEAIQGNDYRSDWSIGLTSNQPGVYLSAPILDQDRVVGVVVVKLRIDEIIDIVKQWQYPGGDAFLLNKAGIILTHTKPKYDYQSLTELTSGEQQQIDENHQFADKKILSLGLDNVKDAFNQVTPDNPDEFVFYNFQDQDKIASLTHLREHDWVVGVTIPEKVITSKVNWILGYVIAISLILVLTVGIISILISRLITRPIVSLGDTVNQFGVGNKDARAAVTSQDEIGKLATSFNSMADTISQHTLDLESLVSERTQKLEVLNKELLSLSVTDQLTGCYNRRYLEKQFKSESVRTQRYQLWMTIVLIDLDHFKTINDQYGHIAGDAILKEFGNLLRQLTREDIDHVVRYGGEEFVLLLPQTNLENAANISRRICNTIENHAFLAGGFKIDVTASFGVTSINFAENNQPINLDDVIDAADELLYTAKSTGRNRIITSQYHPGKAA